MRGFFKGSKAKIGAAIAAGTLVTSNAMAAATLTAPTFELDDIAVVAGALLIGLAGRWAIKNGIALAK